LQAGGHRFDPGTLHHGLRAVAGDPPISAEPWIVRTNRARSGRRAFE
jgi:hypothetical protein